MSARSESVARGALRAYVVAGGVIGLLGLLLVVADVAGFGR